METKGNPWLHKPYVGDDSEQCHVDKEEQHSRLGSLTSVTIPNSVTEIGMSGKHSLHCTSLTSVTIGNSVTRIGGAAFYYLADQPYVGDDPEQCHVDRRQSVSCSARITVGDDPEQFTEIQETIRGVHQPDVFIGNSVTSIGTNECIQDCSESLR